MAFCPAATATAAIFTALIVLDIVNKNYNNILLHVSGGVFSVLGIFVICNALGNVAGWGFLFIPFLVLLVGFLLIWIDSQKDSPTPEPQIQETMPCMDCGYAPCRCPHRFVSCPPAGNEIAPLPPAVTNIPPRKPESTLGCPTKQA